MEKTRKIILRVHGTILMIVGTVATVNATLGVYLGKGSYDFLQNNRLAYVGLLQAYLLAVLIGIVLWLGSYQQQKRKWNFIGAAFHFLILIVYVLHWNFFTTLPNGEVKKCRCYLSRSIFYIGKLGCI